MSDNIKTENIENNKENNKENNEKIKTINSYGYKKKVILPNLRKYKIKTQALKLLQEIDKRIEKNSIFITDDYKLDKESKTARLRKRRSSLIQSYNDKDFKSIGEFNVFGNEDNFIKNLMDKFNKKSQPKIKKMEKKKEVLDKLYGIDPLFKKKMLMAKRNKKLPLEEYQAQTFKILSNNDIGKTELFDLAYNLKCLRLESDSVSPLPPINVSIIYDHVYRSNSNKDKKINKMTIKQLINDTHEPKDEFEKEEKLIKQMMSYKAIQRGKRNKAFDILPEYLKNALSKRFKKNI
jgi:hypothetical protein